MAFDFSQPAISFEGVAEQQQAPIDMPGVKEPPTVVVFGVPRGGTTMVAGIVQRCGVDLGSKLPINLEDQAFVGKGIDKMVATIRERDSLDRIWGWKYPRASGYLCELEPHLRNPHYIVVWRDIFANSYRGLKKGSEMIDALKWAHKIQAQNIKVLEALKGPKLLISYEKALLNPVGLSESIMNFVGTKVKIDEDELLKFATPGTYKGVEAA